MVISEILSRVVILVFPSIVCNLVYGILRNKPTKKDWEDFLQILMFSVISYAIFDLIVAIIKLCQTKSFALDFSSLAPFIDEKQNIEWITIFYVTIIGVVLGIISAYVYKNRWLTRFGIWLKVTDIYSDEDVWSDFFDHARNEWVIVRDYKRSLTYFGWVKYYSNTDRERELTLGEVSFYNGTKEELDEPLYSRDSVYVSLSQNEYSVELMEQAEESNGDLKMDDKENASGTQVKKPIAIEPDNDVERSSKGKKPSKEKPVPKKNEKK